MLAIVFKRSVVLGTVQKAEMRCVAYGIVRYLPKFYLALINSKTAFKKVN